MVTKNAKVGAVIALILFLFPFSNIRSFGQGPIPDNAIAPALSEDLSRTACANSSPDASVSAEGCPVAAARINDAEPMPPKTQAGSVPHVKARPSRFPHGNGGKVGASKGGGGGGWVAFATFLTLLTLWCIRCSWPTRSTLLHR
jgi:hypothetical protein